MADDMKKKMRRRHRLLALALVILLTLLAMPVPALADEVAEGPVVTSEVAPAAGPVEEVVPTKPAGAVEEEEAAPVEEEAAAPVEDEPAVEEGPAAPKEPAVPKEPAPAKAALPEKSVGEEEVVSAPRESAPQERDLFLPSPKIKLIKTGPAKAYPGQWITYNFTVSNPGPLDLHLVTLYDAQIGLFKYIGTLKVGETETTCFDFQMPRDAKGVYKNTACAFGLSLILQKAEDTDHCNTKIVKPPKPGISLKKSGPDYACVGSQITYEYKITNTGDLPLENIKLIDNKFGEIPTCPSLAPKESVRVTHDVVVGSDWRNPFWNRATVTADVVQDNNYILRGGGGGGKQTVSDTAKHCLRILDASILLTKTGPESACVGEEITYTYTVKNTGKCALANVTLTDDKFGEIASWESLAPKESVQATHDVIVGDDWENPYVNEGMVTADVMRPNKSNGNLLGKAVCSVSDTDQHSLIVLDPAISLDKSVTPTTAAVGDTVTYTFEVTNTGDTDLTDVVLVDDHLGEIGDWATLAMGATETVTVDYVLEQDDVPEITNLATVTAITPCETEVSATATATVEVTGEIPAGAINIDKSVVDGPVLVGDPVSFVLTITNTGQTDIVAPVAVVDTYDATMLSFQSASLTPTSAGGGLITWADASGGAGIAPEASIAITVTFLTLEAGGTTNVASVSAQDGTGTQLSSSSSAALTIDPALAPELPITPVSVAAPSGVLPVTGADFLGVLLAALILIPLGLLGLTAGAIRRRSRRK